MDRPPAATDGQRFSALMERVRQGSQEAAAEVWHTYGTEVVVVVRRMLSRRMRSKADSDDFAQAVWASFFADVGDRQIDSPEALVRLLAAMAHNKVTDEIRRTGNRKGHRNREFSLEGSGAAAVARLAGGPDTPSNVAVEREHWERLLAGRSDQFQRIVEQRRAGLTIGEIARRENVSQRTVQRVITEAGRVMLKFVVGKAP